MFPSFDIIMVVGGIAITTIALAFYLIGGVRRLIRFKRMSFQLVASLIIVFFVAFPGAFPYRPWFRVLSAGQAVYASIPLWMTNYASSLWATADVFEASFDTPSGKGTNRFACSRKDVVIVDPVGGTSMELDRPFTIVLTPLGEGSDSVIPDVVGCGMLLENHAFDTEATHGIYFVGKDGKGGSYDGNPSVSNLRIEFVSTATLAELGDRASLNPLAHTKNLVLVSTLSEPSPLDQSD